MHRFLADNDLIAFLVAVVTVLIKAPKILRQRAPVPAEYNMEEVQPQTLTEKQRHFFESYDQKLAALNYFPVCTYRVTNLARTLIRRYGSPVDPASCAVTAMEVKYRYKNEFRWAPTRLVTFRTDFTDGTSLITRNMKRKTLLDTVPGFTIQECPTLDDPAALKKRHDAKTAALGCPQPASSDVKRIFEQIRDEHQRFSEYQVQRGTYARHPQGYVLTSKVHWRGIRNHFNPFVQRVAPVRMVFSALAAVGLPSLTYAYFSSAFAAAVPSNVMNVAMTSMVFLLLSYIVAGAAIGLLIERNAFLWAFLLTYLGVHACTGWWISAMPYSTIAGGTAFWVTRLQHKRKLMLGTAG